MRDQPRLDDRQLLGRMREVRSYFRERSGLGTLFDADFHRAYEFSKDIHEELYMRSLEENDG